MLSKFLKPSKWTLKYIRNYPQQYMLKDLVVASDAEQARRGELLPRVIYGITNNTISQKLLIFEAYGRKQFFFGFLPLNQYPRWTGTADPTRPSPSITLRDGLFLKQMKINELQKYSQDEDVFEDYCLNFSARYFKYCWNFNFSWKDGFWPFFHIFSRKS